MKKLDIGLPHPIGTNFLFLVLLSWFPLSALADSVGCNDTYVQLANNELVINVAATNSNDTVNIQCALDAAADTGVPIVRLNPDTYFISQVIAANFNGTLEGKTMTSTTIEVLDRSIDCSGMVNAGLLPSAIKFVGGAPRLRYLTIKADESCKTSSPRLQNIVHFTGKAASDSSCSNDVIFGVVDRVILDGSNVNTGPIAAVVAHAEGTLLGGCKDTLLGTFKFNRSEVRHVAFGAVTSMKAGAQVDINFSEFTDNLTAIYLLDTNQNTTVTQNKIFGGSTAGSSYVGIFLQTDSPDAPTNTRAVINGNEFNVTSSFGQNSYAVAFSQPGRIADVSSVVSNNTFNLSGNTTNGVFGSDVSNTHVANNHFNGNGDNAVFASGFVKASGWTIIANTGLGSFSSNSGWDIWLGSVTFGCIIGPSQNATWTNLGSGNAVLNSPNSPLADKGSPTEGDLSVKNMSTIESDGIMSSRHQEDFDRIYQKWTQQ